MSLQSAVLVYANETLSDDQLAARQLFKGYPDGLLRFATVSCVTIMFIGILGNVITIAALARYKKVRNATAMFIMNLSFSDLLFCFNIPFAASIFYNRAWIYGQILCRIILFTRYSLFINSLFTVLAITVNRYILIAHPTIYTKIYTKRYIILMLLCSWIFSIGSIIPIVFIEDGSCSILKDQAKRSLKRVIFSTAFILTCTVIIFCYARIFWIVRKASKKSLNPGKRVSNPKVFLSDDLSISISENVTDETSCAYMSEWNKVTKMSSENKNTTERSPQKEISDKVEEQPKKMEKQSRIHQAPQKKSFKFLNIALPTKKDKQPKKMEKQSRIHQAPHKKSFKFLNIALPTKKDKRLGTMIIAIMITFFLCHIPIMITKVILAKSPQPILNITALILFFMTFSINPIIYVVMSNEYRKAYKNLFKCR